MFLIYVCFVIGWVCVLCFSDGKHNQEKFEIVYKVHEMSLVERIWTSVAFLAVVLFHMLAYWLGEKLSDAKELLIIEQEDVIVQLSDHD